MVCFTIRAVVNITKVWDGAETGSVVKFPFLLIRMSGVAWESKP